MTWCFRLRFHLSEGEALGLQGSEWVLLDAAPQRVTLRPRNEEEALTDARVLVLWGSGYDSEDRADAVGRQWRDWLTLALASVNVGVDFGDRAPGGGLTDEGRQVHQEGGHRVLNDVHGLMTFECDPKPVFVSVTGVGVVVVAGERVMQALARARAVPVEVSTSQRIAYDLSSASRAETTADARFVMLMMAVETLIDPQPRSEQAVALVDAWIAEVKARDDLPAEERRSLAGALRWLRQDSIRQAGRRLAAPLGDHLTPLLGEDPETFFKGCYDLRNELVHGKDPRPTRDVVDARAAALEVFVSALISEDLPHPG